MHRQHKRLTNGSLRSEYFYLKVKFSINFFFSLLPSLPSIPVNCYKTMSLPVWILDMEARSCQPFNGHQRTGTESKPLSQSWTKRQTQRNQLTDWLKTPFFICSVFQKVHWSAFACHLNSTNRSCLLLGFPNLPASGLRQTRLYLHTNLVGDQRRRHLHSSLEWSNVHVPGCIWACPLLLPNWHWRVLF